MPSTTSKTKKPQDHKPKYGAGWGTNLTDLELPSGELCQVKRPGVQGLIESKVLHSMDVLTSIVQSETIPKAEGKPLANVEAVIEDPEKFTKMMETVDRIVVHVVTQPKVLSDRVTQAMVDNPKLPYTKDDLDRKLEDEERDPQAIYVDYIDTFDKMFIMNFAVGGSRDLVEFRKASEALVGGVPAGEESEDSTE